MIKSYKSSSGKSSWWGLLFKFGIYNSNRSGRRVCQKNTARKKKKKILEKQ